MPTISYIVCGYNIVSSKTVFALHTISISITVGLLFPNIKLVKSKIWVIENMTNSFQMQDNQAWRIYVVI